MLTYLSCLWMRVVERLEFVAAAYWSNSFLDYQQLVSVKQGIDEIALKETFLWKMLLVSDLG